MKHVNASLTLNLHRETVFLRPILHSLRATDIASLGEVSFKYHTLYAKLKSLKLKLICLTDPQMLLLWPSHFLPQQSLNFLRLLIKAIDKQFSEIIIDIYGSFEAGFDILCFDHIRLIYRGLFEKFSDISPHEYDVFKLDKIKINEFKNIVLEAGWNRMIVSSISFGDFNEYS